jgi:hypothetical protein
VQSTRFDRLAATRRNRRFRNISATVAGFAFLIALVIGLDPFVSGSAPHYDHLSESVVLFVVSFSVAAYFHMRFITRE